MVMGGSLRHGVMPFEVKEMSLKQRVRLGLMRIPMAISSFTFLNDAIACSFKSPTDLYRPDRFLTVADSESIG